MIFAIYVNGETEVEDGIFTKGRLYLAKPEVENASVVDMDRLRITDDQGEQIWVRPDKDRFMYPDEVHAVVLDEIGPLTPGEVVAIEGTSDNGDFLDLVGRGFMRSENFQLLDSTLVKPGMMVYDTKTSRWERVSVVDECLSIGLEGRPGRRSVSEFLFAVVYGELAMVPVLRCVDASGLDTVCQDGVYRVTGLAPDGQLLVIDDNGDEKPFRPGRFVFL